VKSLLLFNKVWRGNCVGDGISQVKFTARMIALQSLVERKHGVVLEVQDESWHNSFAARQIRPMTLINRIRREQPDVIILQYPNYPFFWDSSSDITILRSLIFTRMLQAYSRLTGCRLVLDYRDIINLKGYTAEQFEKAVFSIPNEIWVQTPDISAHSEKIHKYVSRRGFVMADAVSYKHVIRVVPNGAFPCDDHFESNSNSDEFAGVKFVYAGDLRRGDRGIEQMVEAISKINGKNCRFYLCGHNSEWLQDLLKDIDNIILMGELPRSKTMALMRSCDVGMICNPPILYDYCFPTKLAEYVRAGLAVLSTSTGFTARYVEDNGIGVAAPFEQWHLAIERLVEDTERRLEMNTMSRSLSPSVEWDRIYDRAYAQLEQAAGF